MPVPRIIAPGITQSVWSLTTPAGTITMPPAFQIDPGSLLPDNEVTLQRPPESNVLVSLGDGLKRPEPLKLTTGFLENTSFTAAMQNAFVLDDNIRAATFVRMKTLDGGYMEWELNAGYSFLKTTQLGSSGFAQLEAVFARKYVEPNVYPVSSLFPFILASASNQSALGYGGAR